MDKYPALIVVEGKTDKDLIESFLNADICITNGSEVSRETIYFIKEAATKRTVIVLTDPDSPGKRIRDVLNAEIPSLLHAYIPKEFAIKHHKVGVAESSKAVILEALNHLIPADTVGASGGSITFNDLMELGLISGPDASKRRDKLGKALHLGHTNGKALLKRCNALGLTRKNLEDALNG